MPSVDQKIDARCVAMLEAKGTDGVHDGIKIPAIDCHIEVASQAGRERIPFVDVKEGGQSPNEAVLDFSLRERLCQPAQNIKNLFHVAVVGCNGQHGVRFDYRTGL